MYKMKNKKGQLTQIIISLSVLLIIGVVVLQVIFSQVDEQTSTSAIADDSFSATNASCTSITTRCIADNSVVVTNASDIITGNYTECDSTGDAKINGLRLADDPLGLKRYSGFTVNASYNERSCAFITGGITTTILNNLPVLFAVLLLVIVAAAIVIK